MSESLSVKYRPHEFSEVSSQSSIIKILERQIELKQFKNSYLFAGASGCGKTTIARIFANAINEGVGYPIEIDGASNNGVDNVKSIIKAASERSIDSKYKVYIIDECHALTSQAWQAFLKCIEEPPTYTIFIFCTTDPQKIPATILNRVMRFNFTRIKSDVIKSRLKYICDSENFTNYNESIDYISKICNGGMRDAIALLDKVSSYDTDININNTLTALGNYSYDIFFNLVNSIIDGKEAEVIQIVNSMYNDGADLKLMIDQFLTFCLDINKYAIFKDCKITSLPESLEDKLKYATNFDNSEKYYSYIVNKVLDIKNSIKNDTNIKSTIEIMLLNMCRRS